MAGARATLGEVSFAPGDVVEAGDDLVVPVRVVARPRDGAGSIQMDYAYVFRFRGDKIAAATSYRTLAEALQTTTATQ
jgi:ketosteroid isomerase-like protein